MPSNGMYHVIYINCTNLTDEECFPPHWKRRYPLGILIVISIIYFAIFLVGVFGNVTTCIVIYRTKFMHTATNFYLVNLSVSDLLVLILRMPFDIYSLWRTSAFPYSLFLCFSNSLSSESCTYSSVLTVVAFTVERYLAICHPMACTNNSQHHSGSLRRSLKVIALIWVFSLLFGSLMASLTGLIVLHRKLIDGGSRPISGAIMCQVLPDRMERFRYSFAISSVALFIVPVVAITVLYVLIGLAVKRSIQSTRKGSNNSTNWEDGATERRGVNQARARRAVIKMLVAIVIAFVICYAPFHANRMIGSLVTQEVFMKYKWLKDLDKAVFWVSGVFFYASSIINPILYNLMSLKFRKAFRNTILNVCCRWLYKRSNNPREVLIKPSSRPPRRRRRRGRPERPAANGCTPALQPAHFSVSIAAPVRLHHSAGNMPPTPSVEPVSHTQHSLPASLPKSNGLAVPTVSSNRRRQELPSSSGTSCSKSGSVGVAEVFHLSDPFCAQRADFLSCTSATWTTMNRVNLCPQNIRNNGKLYVQRSGAPGRRRYSDGLPSQGLFQVRINDFHGDVEQRCCIMEEQRRQLMPHSASLVPDMIYSEKHGNST